MNVSFISKYALLAITLSVGYQVSYARENSCIDTYLGLSLGIDAQDIEYSKFVFGWSGQILFTKNNRYLKLSYVQLHPLDLNWPGDDRNDNSRIYRFEAVCGSITNIKEDHKLLSRIYVGALIGVAYNSIDFYKDSYAYSDGYISHNQKLGAAIGFTLSNSLNSSLFVGSELKFHFMHKAIPGGEINFFVFVGL